MLDAESDLIPVSIETEIDNGLSELRERKYLADSINFSPRKMRDIRYDREVRREILDRVAKLVRSTGKQEGDVLIRGITGYRMREILDHGTDMPEFPDTLYAYSLPLAIEEARTGTLRGGFDRIVDEVRRNHEPDMRPYHDLSTTFAYVSNQLTRDRSTGKYDTIGAPLTDPYPLLILYDRKAFELKQGTSWLYDKVPSIPWQEALLGVVAIENSPHIG